MRNEKKLSRIKMKKKEGLLLEWEGGGSSRLCTRVRNDCRTLRTAPDRVLITIIRKYYQFGVGRDGQKAAPDVVLHDGNPIVHPELNGLILSSHCHGDRQYQDIRLENEIKAFCNLGSHQQSVQAT